MIDPVLECLRMLWLELAKTPDQRESGATDQNLEALLAVLCNALKASVDDRKLARSIPPGISRVVVDEWNLTSKLGDVVLEVEQFVRLIREKS